MLDSEEDVRNVIKAFVLSTVRVVDAKSYQGSTRVVAAVATLALATWSLRPHSFPSDHIQSSGTQTHSLYCTIFISFVTD